MTSEHLFDETVKNTIWRKYCYLSHPVYDFHYPRLWSSEIFICLCLCFFLFFLFFFFRITSNFAGNHWFSYSYAVFQIFSRNAVDGTPVQYGDIVGFRFPHGGSSSWLYRSSSNFYALSCSSSNKYSCAYPNSVTGFKIFKNLWNGSTCKYDMARMFQEDFIHNIFMSCEVNVAQLNRSEL